MRLRELESSLQTLKGFNSPKIELEQYVTSGHLASQMLFMAQSSFDDILNKNVLDLGCGCGILSIGSIILGSNYTLGVEIDPDAIEIAKSNLEIMELDETERPDFIQADIRLFISLLKNKVMNPPFGTKNKGIDMIFLQLSTKSIYSLHKSSTRKFIEKKVKEWGFKGEVLAEMKYDLPQTMKIHKHKTLDIEVDFWRFEKLE
ncbi:S-adenosyl-L-methionine-dependent methyltransferase [Phakopsora pachyrhizi]|nr:S-adenosyl-L-methionine-dependent methyltransferase [Phakopsora pachyrhizi]